MDARDQRLLKNAEDYFHALDKNHDGYLDRFELQNALDSVGIPITPAFIDLIISECDTELNGKISLDEFINFSKKKDAKLRELFDKLDISNTGDLNSSDIKTALELLDY
jgi:Ca2+-binding EF-hand superfamily protein